MAKRRKRRRPKAGPPPVKNPRHEERRQREERGEEPAPKGPGAPRPVSYKGIAIRAGIVAVLFLPYLVYFAGEPPAVALVWTVLAFALMMPVGIVVDRMRYRLQMRRYRAHSAERG
jgi:hypothetical protein